MKITEDDLKAIVEGRLRNAISALPYLDRDEAAPTLTTIACQCRGVADAIEAYLSEKYGDYSEPKKAVAGAEQRAN